MVQGFIVLGQFETLVVQGFIVLVQFETLVVQGWNHCPGKVNCLMMLGFGGGGGIFYPHKAIKLVRPDQFKISFCVADPVGINF